MGDRDAARAAYEALREHVLAGAGLASPGGLVVLLREGLLAWLADRWASAAPGAPTLRAERSGPAAQALDELRGGVVGLLAGMALAGRENNA
jgi:hypothetical protein